MHSLRRHFRPSQKEIGRASCRERGEISVGAVSFKKKKGNTRWNCDWSSDVCSSDLLADKDKPVLVFDSCIHSGDTLDPVKKTMEEAGFEDIMIGSINPVGRRSRVRTDFHITSKDPEKGCYPFDKDRMIEKVFDHVYSQRTSDPQKRQLSIELRKEIKRIIDEHLPVQRSLR